VSYGVDLAINTVNPSIVAIRDLRLNIMKKHMDQNKGTYLHTLDNRNYLLDLTLEQLENELDPTNFFRANRKYIIPLKTIKEIQLYSNSRLKVILPTYNEEEVVVARERVNEFKEWLG
jgi:DNA-binding LytR/AlgR family response regulator